VRVRKALGKSHKYAAVVSGFSVIFIEYKGVVMKYILYSLIFFAALASYAGEDLDLGLTQAENHPYEVDELDAVFQEDQTKAPIANTDKANTVMKIEMNQAEPSLLTPEQTMTDAEKLALDNQRRQKAIRKELAEGASMVKTCITRNNKNFRGTHVTLRWTVSAMGKVQDAKIKSTDIGDLAIRDCIKRAAAHFDFSDARGDKFKKSIVEYTFKFNNKNSRSQKTSQNSEDGHTVADSK
jgi:hypothetical protein